MNSRIVFLPVLGLSLGLLVQAQVTAPAAAPTTAPAAKVAVIDIQSAMVQTKDGQKALNELQTKFSPRKSELDKKQADLAQSQETYRKGVNTLSEDAKLKLQRDIDLKQTQLKRDTEDANAELEQENQRIMQTLGTKLMTVLNRYANERGYTMVFDISSQSSPILFASNTIDITREIIDAYDKSAATAGSATASSAGGATGAGVPANAVPSGNSVVRRPAGSK